MSEFSNQNEKRIENLVELFELVIFEEVTPEIVREHQEVIDQACPSDVIAVVDQLVHLKIPMNDLKTGINKALNLLNKTLQVFPYTPPKPQSFLDCLIQNNHQTDLRMKAIRPLLKELNRDANNQMIINEINDIFIDLSKIDLHYQIKENVFFPLIEKYFPDYRCLQVMWSFHDDIRNHLKSAIQTLNEPDFDLKKFNRLAGDIFFSIHAVRFREERILFPVVSEFIPEEELNDLISDCLEIGFPFIQPEFYSDQKQFPEPEPSDEADLKSGYLSIEQIRLIFNHLPVDITFVDENNKVKFFSTPKKRIFPRTNSIIGREVKNCHPPESVHVVEQIVEAFRSGKKDKASFWIQMKGEFILIQYFAVRDEQGNYKGVVEVSQEISEIQNIRGEKRLLDWTN